MLENIEQRVDGIEARGGDVASKRVVVLEAQLRAAVAAQCGPAYACRLLIRGLSGVARLSCNRLHAPDSHERLDRARDAGVGETAAPSRASRRAATVA